MVGCCTDLTAWTAATQTIGWLAHTCNWIPPGAISLLHIYTMALSAIGLVLWGEVGLTDLKHWFIAIKNICSTIANWKQQASYVPYYTKNYIHCWPNILCFSPKQNTALSSLLPWRKVSNEFAEELDPKGQNVVFVNHITHILKDYSHQTPSL